MTFSVVPNVSNFRGSIVLPFYQLPKKNLLSIVDRETAILHPSCQVFSIGRKCQRPHRMGRGAPDHGGSFLHVPDPNCLVVTTCGEDLTRGVDSQSPQFSLSVASHEETRIVAVLNRELKHFAVFCAHEDLLSRPADTANHETWKWFYDWNNKQ